MAIFPTLNPSGTRTFTPGEYPHTVYTSLSGDESRVRHSSVMTGSEVKLSFSGLSETDMLSILSHYQGQFGAYYAFTLPSIIFAGMADATVFTLSRYQWRYQAAPVVQDLPCGTHTVDVQLVSVAPEPAAAQGARLIMVAAIVGGQAASASGLDLTITASFEYGSALAAGLSETVTITFTAGAVSGGSEAYGASLGIGFAFNPGVAAAANGLERTVTVSIAGGAATAGSSQTGLTQTVNVSLSAGAALVSSDVALLLHLDGANNSTAFIDSSINATTITANGNVKISTARSKFGGASAFFDGTRDYLTAPASSLWNLSTGDFTIELWVYAESNVIKTIISQGEAEWRLDSGPSGSDWVIGWITNNAVRIASSAVSINEWHHVAIVKFGATTTMWVDGVSRGTTTAVPPNLSNQTLYIGQNPNPGLSGSQWSFNGNMDEIRICKRAVYTQSFTPPTAAFPNP